MGLVLPCLASASASSFPWMPMQVWTQLIQNLLFEIFIVYCIVSNISFRLNGLFNVSMVDMQSERMLYFDCNLTPFCCFQIGQQFGLEEPFHFLSGIDHVFIFYSFLYDSTADHFEPDSNLDPSVYMATSLTLCPNLISTICAGSLYQILIFLM